jgi:DNA-binding MarR family transcriptional regulator
MKDTRHISQTSGYLLTKLGQVAFESFALKLEPLGLRPKHCGALALLDSVKQPSQQSLGLALGVVPSAVVGVLDDLEELGAISRTPDPDDRRKFRIELTATGRSLLRDATRFANEVDAELLAQLGQSDQKLVQQLLQKISSLLSSSIKG